MEAVPEDMDLPEAFHKISPNNPPILHANIPAFERLLAHNKKAKIVWQHIGWDNTGYMTIELLRRLLTAHPNLYLALRVEERQYDMTGRPIPNRIVDENRRIRPEWLKFISNFPDRFMIGTDNFFGAAIYGPGGQALPQTMKETWSVVDQLPPELAKKVGRGNAARVYNIE
jgi:predicted TIM-barrel fold metal-dependent hydrolase